MNCNPDIEIEVAVPALFPDTAPGLFADKGVFGGELLLFWATLADRSMRFFVGGGGGRNPTMNGRVWLAAPGRTSVIGRYLLPCGSVSVCREPNLVRRL
jgi:hypothetical protein